MSEIPEITTCKECRKHEYAECCIIGKEKELTPDQASEIIRRAEAYEGLISENEHLKTELLKALGMSQDSADLAIILEKIEKDIKKSRAEQAIREAT